MLAKVMLKLSFIVGLAATLLLMAVPFISASPSGGASAYLPLVYAPGQNTLPSINSLTITLATQDEPYSLTVTASDPDEGDVLTLSALQLPGWLSIQPTLTNTWILTGTPTNEDVGENLVQLQVTDLAGAKDVVNLTLTVQNVDDAPYFNSVPAEGLEAIEDVAYTLTVTAVDPDGGSTSITVHQSPAWLTFQPIGNGQASLTGTPTNQDVGANEVALRVMDSSGSTGNITFTINVLNVNDAPLFNPIPVEGLKTIEDGAYTLIVTAVDPDAGDQITIFANEKPAWLTIQPIGNGQASLTGTPTNQDVGANEVALEVIDLDGASSEITFTINVINVNDLPLLTNMVIPTATENTLYLLELIAIDPDGDVVTIIVNDLPHWLNTNDCGTNCLSLEGTPTNQDVGVHVLDVTLDDGISPTFYNLEIHVISANR